MPEIIKNGSLTKLNTFGVDASARYLVPLRSLDDVRGCLAEGLLRSQPRLILGGGSNLLLTRDFPGVVLKPEFAGIEILREDQDQIWIRAAAGEDWDRFVRHCLKNRWYGLENLVRIPGLVGASPVQNIGAYGVEIETFFEDLEAIDLETGKQRRFGKDACGFGYRTSLFKTEPRDRFLITAVTFRLLKSPCLCTEYEALSRELGALSGKSLTARAVADAVDRIRQRKLPDPETIGNVGSFFKNPIVEASVVEALCLDFPDLPIYPSPEGGRKVAAGWLIEKCGWKGRRMGCCGVHDRQALVIVNHGGATGIEILELAREIQRSVATRFGIQLEPEPRII